MKQQSVKCVINGTLKETHSIKGQRWEETDTSNKEHRGKWMVTPKQ